jgi:hypothetical protein
VRSRRIIHCFDNQAKFPEDMSEGMPEEERKRFAAKAVKDFMKDM